MANTLAVVCALGGTVGYVKGNSLPSLLAGISVGALYGTSAYLIKNNKDYGYELALGTSILLTGAVGPRALKTKARVPLGMATLGLLGTGYYSKKLYQSHYGV
ncbi:hypothetical protein HDU99_004884 [Rhizoclosmatium hyalinum]|nr:hypothetical protein HDU99_004884 [Rhizoclosmatium hyalinum]